MEIIQVSLNGERDKQIVDRTLLSNKRELNNETRNNMNKSQMHWCQKARPKRLYTYASIYMIFLQRQNFRDENKTKTKKPNQRVARG